MKVIVDRIEGNFLVVELPNGDFINIDKNNYPTAKEGDIIDLKNKKILDNSKRRKEIEDKMNKLFK